MSKRVKVKVLLPPATIYQHATVFAEGYAPSEASRFAVVRPDKEAHWRLTHRRSGGQVGSLLPARAKPYTAAELLAVIEAWEAASYLDMLAFDLLPETTRETHKPPNFGDKAPPPTTVARMRELAVEALS